MNLDGLTRQRWTILGLIGVVPLLATLTSLHLYLNWRLYGDQSPYAAIWAAEAVEWTIWAAFAPVIWTVDRRFGTGTGRMVRAIFLHLGMLVAFYAAQNAVMSGVGLALGVSEMPEGGFGEMILLRASNHGPSVLMIYGLILATAILVRESGRRSRQRTALEAELAEARLRYLRAQIQPHFLFNTLHGIAGLVREGEREEAVQTIGLLGRLLRHALSVEADARVELGDELEDLETYIDIQRMRFGDRIRFTTEVPAELASEAVPALLLQPLVENAIRHGLGPEGGHIHVSAARENDSIVLQVRDDGGGLAPEYVEGIGLGNLRARLDAMYGPRARLDIDGFATDGRGVRVRIRLPANGSASSRG